MVPIQERRSRRRVQLSPLIEMDNWQHILAQDEVLGILYRGVKSSSSVVCYRMKIIFPMQTVIGKMEETRVNVDFNEERGKYSRRITW